MGSEIIAQWAIDSEAIKTRGIFVLVKSNQLVKKYLLLVKARQRAIQPPLLWFSKDRINIIL